MGDNPPLFIDSDVDTFAWEFLRSPYAGPIYADWSLDRPLDTFLRRQGFSRVADDCDLSNIVLDRIMAYGSIVPRGWRDMADGLPAGAHPVSLSPSVPTISQTGRCETTIANEKAGPHGSACGSGRMDR